MYTILMLNRSRDKSRENNTIVAISIVGKLKYNVRNVHTFRNIAGKIENHPKYSACIRDVYASRISCQISINDTHFIGIDTQNNRIYIHTHYTVYSCCLKSCDIQRNRFKSTQKKCGSIFLFKFVINKIKLQSFFWKCTLIKLCVSSPILCAR